MRERERDVPKVGGRKRKRYTKGEWEKEKGHEECLKIKVKII